MVGIICHDAPSFVRRSFAADRFGPFSDRRNEPNRLFSDKFDSGLKKSFGAPSISVFSSCVEFESDTFIGFFLAMIITNIETRARAAVALVDVVVAVVAAVDVVVAAVVDVELCCCRCCRLTGNFPSKDASNT